MDRTKAGSGALRLLLLVPSLAGCPTATSEAESSAATEASGAVAPSADEAAMTGDELCTALLSAPLDSMLLSCGLADQGPSLEARRAAITSARKLCSEEIAGPLHDRRLVLDVGKARACIAEVERAGSAWIGPHAAALNLAPFAACRGLFAPRQALGDPCTSGLDCKAGLRCTGSEHGVIGRCTATTSMTCSVNSAAFGIERRSECGPSQACSMWGADEESALPPIGGGELGNPHKPNRKRSAPPVGVSLGWSKVEGRLPPEVVARVLRREFAGFRACYEDGLKRAPALQGGVTVAFTINKYGVVTVVSQRPSTLPDAAVKTCIAKRIGMLSFPEPEGASVAVVFPMEFAPTVEQLPRRTPVVREIEPPHATRRETWMDGGEARCVSRVAAGERCGSDEVCRDGLVCREKCTTSKDAARTCELQLDCPLDQYCSTMEGPGAANRCQPKKAAGAACTASSECKGACETKVCRSLCGSG